MKTSIINNYLLLLIDFLFAGSSVAQNKWVQSYNSGYIDKKGKFAGGSEIMHLVSHKGKIYAANGYWMDARWAIPPIGQRQSAQVLRLDSSESEWQVDLDTGLSNVHGLEYMKGNVLKSVTFTRDENGNKLVEPVNILVMASGANFERGGAVSSWARDDDLGTWHHTLVRHGSTNGGVRWVPRDMEVHIDKVTGKEKIFLSLGNPGIVSGTYDQNIPGKIRWDNHVEYPSLDVGSFRTRPLGIAIANGSLFFSEGGAIFKRIDGRVPKYIKVLDFHEDSDTDVGGIRGLTTIENPEGPGQSLLFLWAPGDRSECQVKRLDPVGKGKYKVHNEIKLIDLMSDHLGAEITYTLGAHNMMYSFIDVEKGKKVHLIGFQGNIKTKKHLRWKGSALYAGALYAVRQEDQTYKVLEVNNAFRPGKRPLVAPRAFCYSPFGDDQIYFGGHDSSRKVSDNMAWIFNVSSEVALGKKKGKESSITEINNSNNAKLLNGPIYELRIYSANEGRFGDLIERFRNHTHSLFKKHGLEAIGYWIPTEGPALKRRRFIYILKHQSRHDAYINWVNFSNDKEWERVLDQPKFQGLLSLKPVSLFMKESEFSSLVRNGIEKTGGVYELRTYVSQKNKIKLLEERFSKSTASLFNKHGMKNIYYWTAFDEPHSKNTLISLLHHSNRAQANSNWKSFNEDHSWKKVLLNSRANGPLISKSPERIYLKPMNFSPLN